MYPGVQDNFHIARRMALKLQELLTLPAHLSTPPIFCGVRVARSLGFDFVDHCNCFMYLFIKQLYCLFFFDLQLLGPSNYHTITTTTVP